MAFKMELMKRLAACVALLAATAIVSSDGQFLPGPRYSLDNMPKTGFTCRDKILGGYYADSETQCQMFHVCVKVAGVGIQDFRFLCPNGTAFDQEAQICADWGDVDCEAATLYYGSDNFDLYRLGSGFESKRAPFAEEEEATFHLQRAETSDARRSKQYIVNQSSKPQQPPSFNQIPSVQKPAHQQQQQQQQQQQYYRQPVVTTSTTSTTTTTTPFTPAENGFYKNIQPSAKLHQKHVEHKQHQLLLNQQQLLQAQHYRQLTAVAATATPSDRRHPTADEIRTTTPSFGGNSNSYARNNAFPQAQPNPSTQPPQQQQQQQQQRGASNDFNNDEIFRGSHSSHFFNNRNHGKEDYEEEHYRKNAAAGSSRATAPGNRTASGQPGVNRGRNRGRGSVRAHNVNALRSELKPTSAALVTVAPPAPPQQQSRTQNVQHQQQQQRPQVQQLQTTKLQTTTPDDFVDIPKIPNFRQQPSTVLKPQQPASGPVSPSFTGHAIVSTPAPFARHQPQAQSRNGNAFYSNSNLQQSFPTSSSTSSPAPARDTFKITVTTPPYERNNFNQQQQQQQQFSFNSQPQRQQQQNGATSTARPFQVFGGAPTTTVRPRSVTERSFDEANPTTPQEAQRIRPQSRAFNVVDPARLSQFNYNEYQGSRASSTTTTTSVPPPTTFAPLAAQRQRQPQQQQGAFVNPFFNGAAPQVKPGAQPTTTTTGAPITTISPAVVQRAVPKERYQSIARAAHDGQTPSTVKKFSTLVPKDQYNPTTFKPNAISKKALLQFVNQKNVIGLEKSPFTERVTTEKPVATTKYAGYIPTIPPVTSTSTTTTSTTTTRAPFTTTVVSSTSIAPPNRFFQPPNPKAPGLGGNPITTMTTTTTLKPEIDEDDGQYHPELYEKDFYRNRVKAKTAAAAALAAARNTNGLASLSSSDEEEIFRTAHSQNIAASGNDLILERARQAAARINEFFSSSSVRPTVGSRREQPGTEPVTQQSLAGGKHRKDGPVRSKTAHGAKGAGSNGPTPRPFSKAPTIPPNATITKRPPEDESYDYAYYDTGSPDLPEYDVIEDFGRKRT
ncbi:uncharacterized protein LOC131210024 [Anopheles bellator]|uniref:uncharacterized protein LOC131210024 n=1 Tax=Anopheles bellator TaxID=139047 RepID=UPI002647FD13|nr:uncharacterized protein LOC131210024 [Anopheles bellator]